MGNAAEVANGSPFESIYDERKQELFLLHIESGDMVSLKLQEPPEISDQNHTICAMCSLIDQYTNKTLEDWPKSIKSEIKLQISKEDIISDGKVVYLEDIPFQYYKEPDMFVVIGKDKLPDNYYIAASILGEESKGLLPFSYKNETEELALFIFKSEEIGNQSIKLIKEYPPFEKTDPIQKLNLYKFEDLEEQELQKFEKFFVVDKPLDILSLLF